MTIARSRKIMIQNSILFSCEAWGLNNKDGTLWRVESTGVKPEITITIKRWEFKQGIIFMLKWPPLCILRLLRLNIHFIMMAFGAKSNEEKKQGRIAVRHRGGFVCRKISWNNKLAAIRWTLKKELARMRLRLLVVRRSNDRLLVSHYWPWFNCMKCKRFLRPNSSAHQRFLCLHCGPGGTWEKSKK